MTDSNASFSNAPVPESGLLPVGAMVRVMLVDSDSVFRVGVRSWLQQYPDVQVIEDMSDGTLILSRLRARLDLASELLATELSGAYSSDSASLASPILVLLGDTVQLTIDDQRQVRQWCREIKVNCPDVKVLIAGPDESEAIATARQANADGYVFKSGSPDHLLVGIRQVASGQFQWSTLMPNSPPDTEWNQRGATRSPDVSSSSVRSSPGGASSSTNPSASGRSSPRAYPPQRNPGALADLRFRLRVSGIEQIEAQLNQLLPYLQASTNNPTLYVSIVDRWVIAGRCRELRAARWMVKRLLATPALEHLDVEGRYRFSSPSSSVSSTRTSADLSTAKSTSDSVSVPLDGGKPPAMVPSRPLQDTLFNRWQRRLAAIAQQPIYQATSDDAVGGSSGASASNAAMVPQPNQSAVWSSAESFDGTATPLSVTPVSIRASLFDSLRDRLQSPLQNQTEYPLEIDILREDKKRELLVLILHKILNLLDDLRYSEVQPQQLSDRRSQLFYDLWQSILTDYFGKYYVVQVDGLEIEVVTILSQDARAIQDAIFSRIPFAIDLLGHFLFKDPLEIDSVPYSLGTPEAFERAEMLLDHLVIQLGNSVVYPLLNRLADVEIIKQNFYRRQLMSSREIARFRNTLSWHYRRKQWIDEPTAIFESSYALFTIGGMGIKQTNIYASRRGELDRLSGIPLLMTLLLEFRDALSPRLRGAIAALGSGVIYLLTDVIGRAIGLIGRGIIKGIGSAWQDPKGPSGK